MKILKTSLIGFCLILLFVCHVSGATFTAVQVGNWNAWQTWFGADPGGGEGSQYPGPNDNVDLDAYEVTAVSAVATIPSTGALGTITASGVGTLQFPLNTGTFVLNCTTITAGTNNSKGTIGTSGVAGGNTLTVVCTSITAGASINMWGLYNNSTGGVTNFTGNINGGGINSAYGIYNKLGTLALQGTPIITGVLGAGIANAATLTATGATIVGSSAAGGYQIAGMYNINVAGGITLTNCIFNGSTGAIIGPAYAGVAPTIVTTSDKYITFGGIRYAPELTAPEVKSGVYNGQVLGTLLPTHGIM